ncbi:MAG TPA: hypothetical protein VF026_12640 [Ktedonobacteraceae bacterium]
MPMRPTCLALWQDDPGEANPLLEASGRLSRHLQDKHESISSLQKEGKLS